MSFLSSLTHTSHVALLVDISAEECNALQQALNLLCHINWVCFRIFLQMRRKQQKLLRLAAATSDAFQREDNIMPTYYDTPI